MARLTLALRAEWPGWRRAFLGSALWGALMAASAASVLWYREWHLVSEWRAILLLYAAGGFLAFTPALWIARLLERSPRAAPGRNFAAGFVSLGAATLAMTAFLFSQTFRFYFAQWHQPFGTLAWGLETLFTSAAAVYHFLAMGLVQFLPVGLPALLAFGLWRARQAR